MITIGFTFEVVTPESAECGDAADRGWHRDRAPWRPGALKAALREARTLGISECSESEPFQHSWFMSTGDETVDYRTGAVTNYALHVGGVTTATMRRIARVLR